MNTNIGNWGKKANKAAKQRQKANWKREELFNNI